MATNYPYYQPSQMVAPYYRPPQYMMAEQPQPQIGIKGRPVSSIEEARATSIDFDGSVFYFPDLANKRIYTKQINFDGTSTLNVYELRTMPIESPVINSSQYITREEFETALSQIRQSMIPLPPQVPVAVTPVPQTTQPPAQPQDQTKPKTDSPAMKF